MKTLVTSRSQLSFMIHLASKSRTGGRVISILPLPSSRTSNSHSVSVMLESLRSAVMRYVWRTPIMVPLCRTMCWSMVRTGAHSCPGLLPTNRQCRSQRRQMSWSCPPWRHLTPLPHSITMRWQTMSLMMLSSLTVAMSDVIAFLHATLTNEASSLQFALL